MHRLILRTLILSLALFCWSSFKTAPVLADHYDRYYGDDDSDYERDRIREERHDLEREKDRLRDERDRLAQERDDLQAKQHAQRVQPVQEHCPPGFSPSERKCSQDERRHGCKDVRLPGGLGCVHR